MALNRDKLYRDLLSDGLKIKKEQEALQQSINALGSSVGDGMSQSEFLSKTIQNRKLKVGDATERLTDAYAISIANYASKMQDFTGDFITAFSPSSVRGMAKALTETPNDELKVPPCDNLFKGTFGSVLPRPFKTNIPPAGAKKEIKVLALPNGIGSLVDVITMTQSHEEMVGRYASIIHGGFSAVQAKNTYLTPNDSVEVKTGGVY